MRSRFAILVTLSLLALPASASAQVTGDHCVSLGKVLARNETSDFVAAQYEALKYAAYCQSHEATNSGALDAAYEAFSLDGALSSEKKTELCSKSFEQNGIEYASLSRSSMIFEASLRTIDKCLGAAERGWKIAYEQVHKDSVSLSVANLAAGGSQLIGIDILPPNSMTCDGAPAQYPVTMTSTNAVAMTCTRDVVTNVVDGVTVHSAPDVTLNLRLAEGPFPISMKGYNSSAFQELSQEIVSLDRKVTELSTAFTNLNMTVTSVGTIDKSTFWTGDPLTTPTFDCPAGSALSGFGWDAHSDGTIRGVGTLRYRCSSLTK